MSTLSIILKSFEHLSILERFHLFFALNFPTAPLNPSKFLGIFIFNENEEEEFEEDEESNYLEQYGEYDDFDEDDFNEDEELKSFDDEFGDEQIENDDFDDNFDDDDFDDDLISAFKPKEEVIDKSDIEANQYEDDSLADIIDSDTIEDDDYFYGEYDE